MKLMKHYEVLALQIKVSMSVNIAEACVQAHGATIVRGSKDIRFSAVSPMLSLTPMADVLTL